MADPVAWLVIEKGWPVYEADGEQVGVVYEIAGDENHDIFDGLGIKESRLGHVKYVPAEIVGLIERGGVHLTIAGDRVATLEDLHASTEEQILDESSTWYQRLAERLFGRR